MEGFISVINATVEYQAESRGKTLLTLLFTSLKAVPLAALPLSLDKVLELLRRGRSDRSLFDSLLGVIERVDDTHRRALLCVWWAHSVSSLVRPSAM